MNEGIIKRGAQLSIDMQPITNGKIYYALDTGRLFMDTTTERIEFTDFVQGLTYSEITGLVNPLQKLYLSMDTHQLLAYDFVNEQWYPYSGGETGPIGPTGATGEGLSIYKTYTTVELMEADAENVDEGLFVCIAAENPEDADNGKVYIKNSEGTFTYQTSVSDAQSIQGPTGMQGPEGPRGPMGPTGPADNLTSGQYFVTVSTEAEISEKSVELDGFKLVPGGIVVAKFENGNSAPDVTLEINSTGAREIWFNGSLVEPYMIKANDELSLIFDGIHWQIFNWNEYGDLDSNYVNL